MIFIGGIHGVGKSLFCSKLSERFGLAHFTASSLIAEHKQTVFMPEKRTSNIDENQQCLVVAVNEQKAKGNEFLLDGHFCLLDQSGSIVRVPLEIFELLSPVAILLLTESPAEIVKRRWERDHTVSSLTQITEFQDEEVRYAKEVAGSMQIPIRVSRGFCDFEKDTEFVMSWRR